MAVIAPHDPLPAFPRCPMGADQDGRIDLEMPAPVHGHILRRQNRVDPPRWGIRRGEQQAAAFLLTGGGRFRDDLVQYRS